MSTADLFVQYHEYFQKLQLDMQHTSAAIAQRRTRSGSKARVRIDLNVQCFSIIARSIAEKDKPIVFIGEGDSAPDDSAAGGSGPRMVVREADLAAIRDQLRIAARADSSDASPTMLLSQAVSQPPVDLEGVLEGMATDELSMFVGGGVELQEAGLDLDQLVSVLASDEPLKLEPDMAAGSLAAEGLVSKSQDVAVALEAGAVSQSLEEAGMAAFLKIEDGKLEASAVTRMFSDASETASVSTADVETASNAGSDATGSDAAGSTSDALEATDGWSTPPVPPSPTHGLALPPISPAYKHVRPLAARAKQGEESPSAAFDKSELLDLLSKHCPATPEGPDGPEGELRDAPSSGKRCLDDATAADEGLAKRLHGGAVRA